MAAFNTVPQSEEEPLVEKATTKAPTTAGALFIIGPPRAAPLPCMIERE